MKLLQQITFPQGLALVGFFIWTPTVFLIVAPCVLLIALCMSKDIEDDGRYVCIGACACVLLLVVMLMEGNWHWFTWIAFTAILAWCFGQPIQEDVESANERQKAVSGQLLAIPQHTQEDTEELEWISAEDEYYTCEYKKRRSLPHREQKRLRGTRGYLEGPKEPF